MQEEFKGNQKGSSGNSENRVNAFEEAGRNEI